MSLPSRPGDAWLYAGAAALALLSVLHLAIVPIGLPAYEFFTAGRPMIEAARRGSPLPPLVTLVIAAGLAAFAACTYAAAHKVSRPRLRVAMVGISGIFVLRGLTVVPEIVLLVHAGYPARALVFSVLALLLGLVLAIGTGRSWARLSER
jgi:hypothetical protein